MFELKSISYEEARAEHFRALMKKMQRKIDWWKDRENKLRPLDMASRAHIECSEAGMQYNFYGDALEALENNKFQYETGFVKGFEAAQPKWISVEERLPEECAFYLTYSRRCGRMVLIFYPERKTWVNGETGEFEIKVTHWMPLPEPPKEEV